MHFLLMLENTKIYINTYIKIAPTCFGLRPILMQILEFSKINKKCICWWMKNFSNNQVMVMPTKGWKWMVTYKIFSRKDIRIYLKLTNFIRMNSNRKTSG
jgi:transposase-like protein